MPRKKTAIPKLIPTTAAVNPLRPIYSQWFEVIETLNYHQRINALDKFYKINITFLSTLSHVNLDYALIEERVSVLSDRPSLINLQKILLLMALFCFKSNSPSIEFTKKIDFGKIFERALLQLTSFIPLDFNQSAHDSVVPIEDFNDLIGNIPDLVEAFINYAYFQEYAIYEAEAVKQGMLCQESKELKQHIILHKHDILNNITTIADFFVELHLKLGDISNANKIYALFTTRPEKCQIGHVLLVSTSPRKKYHLKPAVSESNIADDCVNHLLAIKRLNALCFKLESRDIKLIGDKYYSYNLSDNFQNLEIAYTTNTLSSSLLIEKTINLSYFLAHKKITPLEIISFAKLMKCIETKFITEESTLPLKTIHTHLIRLKKAMADFYYKFQLKQNSDYFNREPAQDDHDNLIWSDFFADWFEAAQTLGPSQRQKALWRFSERFQGTLDGSLPNVFDAIVKQAATNYLLKSRTFYTVSEHQHWMALFENVFLDYAKPRKASLFQNMGFIQDCFSFIRPFLNILYDIVTTLDNRPNMIVNWVELLPELTLYKKVIINFTMGVIEHDLEILDRQNQSANPSRNIKVESDERTFIVTELKYITRFILVLCHTGQYSAALELRDEVFTRLERFSHLPFYALVVNHIQLKKNYIQGLLENTSKSESLFIHYLTTLHQAFRDADYETVTSLVPNDACEELNPNFSCFLKRLPGTLLAEALPHETKVEFLKEIRLWIDFYLTDKTIPPFYANSLMQLLNVMKSHIDAIPLEIRNILTPNRSCKYKKTNGTRPKTSIKAMMKKIRTEESRIAKMYRLEEKQNQPIEVLPVDVPPHEEDLDFLLPTAPPLVKSSKMRKTRRITQAIAAPQGCSSHEITHATQEKYRPSPPRELIFNSTFSSVPKPKIQKEKEVETEIETEFKKLELNEAPFIELSITIPCDVANMLKNISDAGHQAYLVGGAVRDILREVEPNDFDIVVDCTQIELEDILNAKLYQNIKIKHAKVYHFGRCDFTIKHKGFSLLGDAVTRDYDCNALYVKHDGRIIDPLNKLKNIISGDYIELIASDPIEKLMEDPIRILRGIEITTRLNKVLCPHLKSAMMKVSHHLGRTPFGALKHHFRKLFLSGNAVRNFRFFDELNLLPCIFNFSTFHSSENRLLQHYILNKLKLFDHAFVEGQLHKHHTEELVALLILPKVVLTHFLPELEGLNCISLDHHVSALLNDYCQYLTTLYPQLSGSVPPLLFQASSSSHHSHHLDPANELYYASSNRSQCFHR
jgi:hypothetical protein